MINVLITIGLLFNVFLLTVFIMSYLTVESFKKDVDFLLDSLIHNILND